MSIALSSPVTGGPQTSFSSHTYTVVADTAVDSNQKRYIVTALNGTQANVRVHSISDPFAIVFVRQKVLNALPSANPISGRYPRIPRNKYWVITEKGVNFAASQAPEIMYVKTMIDAPAGADAYDAPNVKAGQALHYGSLWQQSSGIGDTTLNGNL